MVPDAADEPAKDPTPFTDDRAPLREDRNVIVVGGGNAAMRAALAARESGAAVLILERAPDSERPSSFSSGPRLGAVRQHGLHGQVPCRVTYEGVDDLRDRWPLESGHDRALTRRMLVAGQPPARRPGLALVMGDPRTTGERRVLSATTCGLCGSSGPRRRKVDR